jgi:hypothetical protein
MTCTGCDRPTWVAHATIEEHIACEARQQLAVRYQLDLDNPVTRRVKFNGQFIGEVAAVGTRWVARCYDLPPASTAYAQTQARARAWVVREHVKTQGVR